MSLFRSKTHVQEVPEVVRANSVAAQNITPTIYIIRHGEKPPKLPGGGDAVGLSPEGEKRAKGLVQVFGKKSKYNIGAIFAQQYKPNGSRRRAYDTVEPLAAHLGIPIDYSIDRDDTKAIVTALKSYQGTGNVLLCWEHHGLTKIVKKLGVEGELKYPKHRFDVIWTVKPPYEALHSWTSEGVEGLDDQYKDPWVSSTSAKECCDYAD